MVQEIENETERKTVQQLLDELPKIEAEMKKYVTSTPSQLKPIDFRSWRKRILRTEVLEFAEQRYANLKPPPLAHDLERLGEIYKEGYEKQTVGALRALVPKIQQGRVELQKEIRDTQQKKLELDVKTWNDYFKENPEIEAEWRKKFNDEIKSLYE